MNANKPPRSCPRWMQAIIRRRETQQRFSRVRRGANKLRLHHIPRCERVDSTGALPLTYTGATPVLNQSNGFEVNCIVYLPQTATATQFIELAHTLVSLRGCLRWTFAWQPGMGRISDQYLRSGFNACVVDLQLGHACSRRHRNHLPYRCGHASVCIDSLSSSSWR